MSQVFVAHCDIVASCECDGATAVFWGAARWERTFVEFFQCCEAQLSQVLCGDLVGEIDPKFLQVGFEGFSEDENAT